MGLVNYYLRSDGTWAPVLDEETTSKINSIEAISGLVQSNADKISSNVGAINNLQASIDTILGKIVEEETID
jgi:hypothetical protein